MEKKNIRSGAISNQYREQKVSPGSLAGRCQSVSAYTKHLTALDWRSSRRVFKIFGLDGAEYEIHALGSNHFS